MTPTISLKAWYGSHGNYSEHAISGKQYKLWRANLSSKVDLKAKKQKASSKRLSDGLCLDAERPLTDIQKPSAVICYQTRRSTLSLLYKRNDSLTRNHNFALSWELEASKGASKAFFAGLFVFKGETIKILAAEKIQVEFSRPSP
jgi:hypothetical protein